MDLLPALARKYYAALVEKQQSLREWSESYNKLELSGRDNSAVVITAGLGGNYYEENREDFIASRGGKEPARLHISAYPLPEDSIRELSKNAGELIIIEEGQPFIEERIRGILPTSLKIRGKLDGTMPRTGELDPDNVRQGLNLQPRPRMTKPALTIPGRPPQLCQGCPHGDSFETIKRAISGYDPASVVVTSDIGCYSLGALPPYSVPESIVCMGASIGMARGAAEAGIKYAVATIGDSTFLHSGITGLLDAVSAGTPLTIIILDNSAVAMTGCQDPIIPSAQLTQLILGAGVAPEHCVELDATRHSLEKNISRLKDELEYRGLSVVIFTRECLEAFRRRQKVH